MAAVVAAPGARARLMDIAAAAGLHKNTAFSLLETLCALGYLRQSPRTREYMPGPRLYELARTSEARTDIVRQARPLMLRMMTMTKENVCLAIPSATDVFIATTIETGDDTRGGRYRGGHSPYHASAVGKAMLAFMPAQERDLHLPQPTLARMTPKTLKSRAALVGQLDEIARQGFAISLEEEEIGSNAVASAIVGPVGEVLAAVAVWGPPSRLSPEKLARIGGQLSRECASLSRATVDKS